MKKVSRRIKAIRASEENYLQIRNLRKIITHLRKSERQYERVREILQEKAHNLGERVKELNCLYSVSNLVKSATPIEKILRDVVKLIPPAWQYPEITCVRIEFNKKVYKTTNFRETPWKQSAPLYIKGKRVGSIDVFYLEEKPPSDEGPFLKEERSLINTIAKNLGEIIEKKHAEIALKESLARYRAIMNAIPDTIFRISKDGVLLDIKSGNFRNSKLSSLVGKSIYDLKNRYRFLRGDNVNKGMDMIGYILKTGEKKVFEYTIESKDGIRNYEVVLTRSGSREVLGVVRDITERRKLEREVLSVVERERQRIGQDLHDSICQQLTGIAFLAKVIQKKLSSMKMKEAANLREMIFLIQETITQTRALARGLYPLKLEVDGLPKVIADFAKSVEKLFGVTCKFKHEDAVTIEDSSKAIHIYRIMQEAVTNAIKHGRASEIVIGLRKENGNIMFSIENNGESYKDAQNARKGMGIDIMRYRMSILGGSFEINALKKGGTLVRCVFPSGIELSKQR